MKKDKYNISIIIPVYNVESYIVECLDSVVSQLDESMEVICVNDGSPDNSKAIITQYEDRFHNVKCIDRTNGGLSAARNTGIKAAQGEYLVLLDSDDWLAENVLNRLYEIAKGNDLDVLVGNTRWIFPEKKRVEKHMSFSMIPEVTDGISAFVELMNSEIYVPMAYNYVCKRKFIIENDLFFKEGLIYEDELWTPQVLLKAERVLGSNTIHYNYLQRGNAITSSAASELKGDSFFYVSMQLLRFAEATKNRLLKSNLLYRASILYSRGCAMFNELNVKNKPKIIRWINLINSGVSFEYYNKCLGFLPYSKNQRRTFRLIGRLLLK